MLNSEKVGHFIMSRRKQLGYTQQQLAQKLNISFQAVSKWENGTAYPNIEVLKDLAIVLGISVDEILTGSEKETEGLSYSKAGIDNAYTDAIKRGMAKYMQTSDKRVLNGIGAFASLYDIHFPELKNPVLVLKSEEPGSKQKLAREYGYTESIGYDLINHLVNDVAVMGAKPLAALDTIVCGNAEKDTIQTFVKGISEACKFNECSLVGGETSIQPLVVKSGIYVLTASIVGIVEKSRIIDGSAIAKGDAVLAVASNGLHTNGYSLVRLLMDKMPQIKLDKIDGLTFIEQIMKPHTPYYRAIKDLLGRDLLHGMAHITGGGLEGNISGVIPDGLSAHIDLSRIKILNVFKYIRQNGSIRDEEMLRTFNCGVGLVLIVAQKDKDMVMRHINQFYGCYEIGQIDSGKNRIVFEKHIDWL
ncbi:MAG: phosphoribosylformylglycinamidine cyclo-ligase [Lachnospiraceae bacterium]|nr:phosphoribosylformylglycinamidine cyclo-ligase [Lachnospiraceae bacterium]